MGSKACLFRAKGTVCFQIDTVERRLLLYYYYSFSKYYRRKASPSNQTSRTESYWLWLAWLIANSQPFVAAVECRGECSCRLQPWKLTQRWFPWSASLPHSTVLTPSKPQPWKEGSRIKLWDPAAVIVAKGIQEAYRLGLLSCQPQGEMDEVPLELINRSSSTLGFTPKLNSKSESRDYKYLMLMQASLNCT